MTNYQLIVNILREVIDIFLSTQSKKREVIAFLEEWKQLLGKEDFNIDSDLTLIKKKKPNHFILSPRQYSARLYILQPWGEFLLASWPACLQLTDVTYSRAEKVSREVLIS